MTLLFCFVGLACFVTGSAVGVGLMHWWDSRPPRVVKIFTAPGTVINGPTIQAMLDEQEAA